MAVLLLPSHLPRGMEQGLRAGPLPERRIVHGSIGRNSTLAASLQDTLDARAVHELVTASRPAYDLAEVRPGRHFGVSVEPDGRLMAFTYQIDELRTLRVIRRGPRLEPEIDERHYETRLRTSTGHIRSSLFEAVGAAGERDQLALDLADIFAWDVDFNTELRQGDSFRVAVESRLLDGEFRGYGRVLAAEFVRGERTLRAVGFEDDGHWGYYAPDGTPLRKAFLKSPLKFSRISSRFSRARLHPILHTVRPHLGVDYAAPAGTPVHASADGVVTQAGWRGGFGRAVQVRHANGFQTLYGHLSRIDVRVGQRVSQGDRIGAVGATGLATAPHLDYRMTKGGAFVDPLRVQSPPAEPLGREALARFLATRDAVLAQLPPGATGVRLASLR